MKWWWWSLVLLTGCTGPLAMLIKTQPVDSRFVIRSDGFIEADVKRVEQALLATDDGLRRWGGLEKRVTVYVVSTHDTLESAVHRRGFGWLRAWARYDDVIFQAPATWNASDEVLKQLVLHEVTHCLLFQRSASEADWTKKHIPLWFREGMAIFTAGQQPLYPSFEDTKSWLAANPDFDVFIDGEDLSEDYYQPVYGFALHAFTFLTQRFGEERIVQLMAIMRGGDEFADAFEKAMGMPLERYEKDFLVFIKLRGFRSVGRKPSEEKIDLRKLLKPRPLSPGEVDPGPENDGPGDVSKPPPARPERLSPTR
ncbi:MAG: hypothetical protein ACO1OB_09635 [Archangium sp.]